LSNNPSEALELLDQALQLHRANPELSPRMAEPLIYLWRGGALANLGKPEEALVSLDQALELYERFPNACPPAVGPLIHLLRGNVLGAQGHLSEAVAAWNRSIDLGNQDPRLLNHVAWILVTSEKAELQDAKRAVELAKRATRLAPQEGAFWNSLGVALYCDGTLDESVKVLQKSMDLRKGGDSNDWFFVAMAKHKLGHEGAREWYDKAVAWMEEHRPDDAQLKRFRAKAEEVLGID
jgi:tetratricopeptide (TPR) repeat protein